MSTEQASKKSWNKTVDAIVKSARWIWPYNHFCDVWNTYAQARRTFSLSKVPPRAPMVITADQSYQLFINGRFVCRGPARGFQESWPCDELDVAKYLRKGRNVIAVLIYNPGRSTFQYIYRDRAGLLMLLRCGGETISSDNVGWKIRVMPGQKRDTECVSIQLFPQEHYDARAWDGDWTAIDYDDSSWPAPAKKHPAVREPYRALERRGIPFLAQGAALPKSILGGTNGRCAEGWQDPRNVVFIRAREKLQFGGAVKFKIAGDRASFVVPAAGAGKYQSVLMDFGFPLVGSPDLEVTGAVGGEIVDYAVTEHAADGKATLVDFENNFEGCRMGFGGRLICRKGTTSHRFHHNYGFRHMIITVRNSRAPLKISLKAATVGYPLKEKGEFRTEDSQLSEIFNICRRTQRICMLDAYVDTPWREQAQWWGDARIQAFNTFHLADDARLLARGIRQIGMSQLDNGLTYGHAPTCAYGCILPDFTLIWLLTFRDYWWQSGDLELFKEQLPRIEKALAYFSGQCRHGKTLLPYDDRYWLFLDWAPIFNRDWPTVFSMWLLIAIRDIGELCNLTGEKKLSANLAAFHKNLTASLSTLKNRQTGLFHDGRERNGKLFPKFSLHSQTLAIMAGLIKGDQARRVVRDVIVPYLETDVAPHGIEPSAYWVSYVLNVAIEHGFERQATEFIRRRWQPMISQGSCYENWNPEFGHWSISHAWSAHPIGHLMRVVGGIRQAAESWRKIVFKPIPIGGSFGGADVPTPMGIVSSRWKMHRGVMKIELRLPKEITADVELPNGDRDMVAGCTTANWEINQTEILPSNS